MWQWFQNSELHSSVGRGKNVSWNYILICGTFPTICSVTKHIVLLRGRAQVFLNSATMDLRSSTEWPNLLQLRDTPSALQQKMTWVWGMHINQLDYFLDAAVTLVHFYVTVSSIRCLHSSVYACAASLTLSLPPILSHSLPLCPPQRVQWSGGPVHLMQCAIATLPSRAGDGRSYLAVSEVAEAQ